MAQYIGSLEVTKKEARLIVFESSFRNSKVIKQLVIPIDDLESTDYWEEINNNLDIKLSSLVVNAEASSVSTHYLSFPFKDPRKIESAIDFELENQAPYHLEDMSMTWMPVRSSGTQSNILSGMAVKIDLQEQIAELKDAQCEPHAIVMPAASLADLVSGNDEDPIALLSFDEEESHLSLCHEGLLFARTLRIGGDYIDRIIAEHCSLSLLEAQTLRRKLPTGFLLAEPDSLSKDEANLLLAMHEGMRPLVQSIMMTCTMVEAENAPKRLLLTGRLAGFSGMCSYLEAKLGLPVERLNLDSCLGENVECAENIDHGFGVALAMGLSFLRYGTRLPLNFRRGELSYEGNVELYQGQILRVALGLSLVFMLALGGTFIRYSLIKSEEMALDKEFGRVTKEIIGKEIRDPKRALAILKQSPSEGEGFYLPKYSASTLFEMVSKGLPAEIDVSFENVDFRIDRRRDEGDRINGKGESASFDAIEKVVAALKKDACVQEVEISKQRKTKKTGRVQFHFAIIVKCEGEKLPGETLASASAAGPQKTGAQ